MLKSKQEILNIINHSTGTTAYHRFHPSDNYPVITDGVLALAEATGCFWFIDIIGIYQGNKKLDPHFQVWELKVLSDARAIVRGYNDKNLVIQQEIPYTNFPLDELKLYLIDKVILLPAEY